RCGEDSPRSSCSAIRSGRRWATSKPAWSHPRSACGHRSSRAEGFVSPEAPSVQRRCRPSAATTHVSGPPRHRAGSDGAHARYDLRGGGARSWFLRRQAGGVVGWAQIVVTLSVVTALLALWAAVFATRADR